MVLLIIIPIKWLFHWEYTLFSDKPKWMLTKKYSKGPSSENSVLYHVFFHIKWPSQKSSYCIKKGSTKLHRFVLETQDNSPWKSPVGNSWLGKTAAFLPCNGLASFPSASSTSRPWPIVAKRVPSSRERSSTAQASLWSSRVAFNVWGISPPAIFLWQQWQQADLYPLVMTNIANWKITIFNGNIHYFNGHFQ